MARTYQIADEPTPNRYAQWVSSPHWIFLATILGGAWIGIPWFMFNGYAVGSATRKAEIRAAITSVIASLVVAFVAFNLIDALQVEPTASVGALSDALGLPDRTYAYAWVPIHAIKGWFTYRLFWMQSKSVDVLESYGGKLANGAAIVGAAFLLRSLVLAAALKVSLWLFVVVV